MQDARINSFEFVFWNIGRLDLAAEWAGFKTIGQCEWADYPTKILEKHWPDVPRWRDIRELSADEFIRRTGLHIGQLAVLSGGFPCQPFSVAGKRRGKEDDRYLWPEMLRVIRELRPTWVVGENVAGIVNLALDTVLSDLEAEGYETRTFVFPAHAVGARHRRDRVCIVGHADQPISDHDNRSRAEWRDGKLSTVETDGTGRTNFRGRTAEYEPGKRWEFKPRLGGGLNGIPEELDAIRNGWYDGTWESGIQRLEKRVPNRVNRLKSLGNAVVPQQFYPVFKAIYDIEVDINRKSVEKEEYT